MARYTAENMSKVDEKWQGDWMNAQKKRKKKHRLKKRRLNFLIHAESD